MLLYGDRYPKPQITNLPPDVGIEIFRQIYNSKPVSDEELRRRSEKEIEKILREEKGE